MASTIQIYSNVNTSSRTVTVDFVGEILAASYATNVGSTETEYFFRLQTGARDVNNTDLPVKLVLSLSDLVLNGQKQSATNTAAAYTNVHSMIVDYVYDYVNGHTQDQYSSGATLQRPMKFN